MQKKEMVLFDILPQRIKVQSIRTSSSFHNTFNTNHIQIHKNFHGFVRTIFVDGVMLGKKEEVLICDPTVVISSLSKPLKLTK